jgi:hypothetical protein
MVGAQKRIALFGPHFLENYLCLLALHVIQRSALGPLSHMVPKGQEEVS